VEELADVKLDVRERGANQQTLDRRLFMQLQVFTGCTDTKPLVTALEASRAEAVLYLDVNDPAGVALLSMSEDPAFFVTRLRELVNSPPFDTLIRRPEFAMLGRSYSSGFEPDLEDFLLRRPRRTVGNAAWPWAVWYPLRRTGAFARLTPKEQGAILREHGNIGRAYGDAGLAYDVRLACNGLDVSDNDFVVGLVGPDLYPLSHLVQTMRRTIQTSEYIEKLGPFFIGRACWQGIAG
jgi:chlorite dismutase